jgi:hypothetical protein
MYTKEHKTSFNGQGLARKDDCFHGLLKDWTAAITHCVNKKTILFFTIFTQDVFLYFDVLNNGFQWSTKISFKKRNYAFFKILTWPMMFYIPNEQPLFCFDMLRLLLKAYCWQQ